jgi:Mn2+/Fe2+ NRAMP family transporter
VLRNTFVPHLGLGFVSISSAVALLGATVSPYTMFWQVQGEKEQRRPGPPKRQMRMMTIDIANGVVSGNLIAYFIIVVTSATLFTHHQQIATAADAAKALVPLAGPFAKYLFAVGLIGAGLVAIPVLLASTAYAVSGTFGWSSSLWKKPWQNEGFYLILTVALVISVIVALLRFDPIQIMFWANVLQGLLSPVLVILVTLVANDRKIMGEQRVRWVTNSFLGLTAVVMIAALIFFFVGVFSGHAG